MPIKKTQTWLDRNWPFKHKQVSMNGDTNIIKLVAMITMLVDHLGAAVFPQYHIMRIIGRIAFPIYAYCIAAGCVYTRNIGAYLNRVALTGIIVQPLYVVALNHMNHSMTAISFSEAPLKAIWHFYRYSWNHPSIFFTLALGILAIWALRERKLGLLAGVLWFCYIASGKIDYGYRGVLLILLMYAFINKWYISLPIVGAYMVYWGLSGSRYNLFGVTFSTQMFAVLSLPFIYIPMRSNLKLNRLVFYGFYPAHLLLIHIIDVWPFLKSLIAR